MLSRYMLVLTTLAVLSLGAYVGLYIMSRSVIPSLSPHPEGPMVMHCIVVSHGEFQRSTDSDGQSMTVRGPNMSTFDVMRAQMFWPLEWLEVSRRLQDLADNPPERPAAPAERFL